MKRPYSELHAALELIDACIPYMGERAMSLTTLREWFGYAPNYVLNFGGGRGNMHTNPRLHQVANIVSSQKRFWVSKPGGCNRPASLFRYSNIWLAISTALITP